ncbi:hypothetical protein [Rippkaea orientalis]|nr:hypothetical protein [Rippkaea orientalis]
MADEKTFAKLKTKYNVSQDNNSDFLYFILAKADLDVDLLNDIDLNWLGENNFLELYQILSKTQEDKVNKIKSFAQNNFASIYKKYSFLFTSTPVEWLGFKHDFDLKYATKAIRGSIASILIKLDREGNLNQGEINYLKLNRLDEFKLTQLLNFLSLKRKYNVWDYPHVLPDDRLYHILKKIDSHIQLTDKDAQFIKNHNLTSVLEIYELQQKKIKEEFNQLKQKYQATDYLDSSPNSFLFKILTNLELGKFLEVNEINWLQANNLTDTIKIADLIALKFKYKAVTNEDLSLSSHLYKVLKKIDSNIILPESDINFLKKRKLTEIIDLAINQYADYLINQIQLGQELDKAQLEWIDKLDRKDIIQRVKIQHFIKLKQIYQIDDFRDDFLEIPLYLILQKLEQNQRLEAPEILYLQENHIFYSKIYVCYHTIEAQFYEANYKETGNKWNIPNISSHWRKADEPKKALQSTDNVALDKIKENKLKSAILTTRGGAFRDISDLDKAEECAMKAIAFQPSSHHPYTLMGAICYDRYQHYEGEQWFAKAIARGASPESIDEEIKKSIARMEDKVKRDQLIKKLLEKDPKRYSWSKKYLSKKKNK